MLDVLARRLPRAAACLWCLAAAGCTPPEPPGEQLGIFDVTSKLLENTCGPTAVIAGDSQFPIELRRDDQGRAYWQLLGGQPLLGNFDGTHSFSITVTTFIQLYGADELEEERKLEDPLDFARLGPSPVPPEQERGCTLAQDEVLTVRMSGDWLEPFLDAGVDAGESTADAGSAPDGGAEGSEGEPADLTADHTQTLTPTADSDCTRALGAAGGPFEGLPCEVRYSLRAIRRP